MSDSGFLRPDAVLPHCKGCGHAHVLRALDAALDALEIAPRDLCVVTDIGCVGLADAQIDRPHTVHTTHGRSTAFATGMSLADAILGSGRLKPIVLIGDGGAMIGINHLVRSAQREAILDAFVKAGHHVSVEDLLKIVRRRHPEGGRTTIYRTLKLIQDAGLASELALGGEARFEPVWNRDHHDHFVCLSCGEIFEFQSPDIERLQEEIASGIGFAWRATGTTSWGGAAGALRSRPVRGGHGPPPVEGGPARGGARGMRLEQIEVRRVTLPLRFPFETSFGRTTTKQFLLVSAWADGVTGHAECVADVDPLYLPEPNATALHVLRDFRTSPLSSSCFASPSLK